MSLHGLVEKLSLRQLLLPEEWKYKVLSATNAVRIYGLTGNPNSLALSLFFGIIGIVYLQHVTSKINTNGHSVFCLYCSSVF